MMLRQVSVDINFIKIKIDAVRLFVRQQRVAENWNRCHQISQQAAPLDKNKSRCCQFVYIDLKK
jgi:hypothetical protein